MPDVRDVYDLVTKQRPPDPGALERQHRRQRRHLRNRKLGGIAIGLVPALAIAAAAVGISLSAREHRGPGSSPSPSVVPHPPQEGVYLIHLPTGRATYVPKINPSATTVAVSPDRSMVTYVGDTANGWPVVYVANIDGTNIRSLERTVGSTFGSPYQPSWSPDSSTIVYQRVHALDQTVGNLYLVDAATGRTTQLTHLKQLRTTFYAMAPSFSPDGKTVLFNMPGGDGWDHLWSVPTSGGQPTLVRRHAIFGRFSPNGTRIAYVQGGHFHPIGQLWLARPDGTGAQQLVRGDIEMPRWSPDGTRIAYAENGAIYIVEVRTGQTTKVADLDAWPDWVNDHTLIVDLGD
jgi:Tol biopolymer transport system component